MTGTAGRERITYPDMHGERILVQCPRCGQSAKVELHGSRVAVQCFTGCSPEETLAGLGSDRLLAELREAAAATDERHELHFLSPAEVQASTPPEPPWILNGYLAGQAVSLLAGKPKAGKSTLALAMAGAVAHGAPHFLGRAVTGGPVVYVSEEGAATLAHKLPASESVRVLTRDAAWPKPEWPALVTSTVAEAERVGAALIVIDTFSFWAALPAEREKDAGAAQAVMEPLLEAARAGFAVLLVHHSRKGGGEDGEGVRGSSALTGAADIVLELERPREEGTPPHQRVLLALSRYPQTPGALLFDHDVSTGSWGAIGEAEDRASATRAQRRGTVLAALGDDELTRAELEDLLGDAREWKSVLDELVSEDVVARSGAGKRGDPHRWRRILWRESPTETTETENAANAVSGVCPYRTPRNGSERAESCGATETGRLAPPRPHEVWVDAEVPEHRLRVLDVEGDLARLRVETGGGEELELPLAAFSNGLRRVA